VSIWEGLLANPSKPESWVTTQIAVQRSRVTPEDGNEGLNTPLAPFYKDKDTFWTSDDVRDTRTFGYAYPETKSWNFANTDDYRKDIEQQLRALYPSGSLATMIIESKAGDEQPEAILRKQAEKLARINAVTNPPTAITALSLAQAASPTTESLLAKALPPLDVPTIQVPDGRSLAHLAKGDTYLEWLVNIKAVKHALGGEYSVHIFLGRRVPPEEPTTLYAVSPYHVGTFTPLGQSEATACSKCQRDQAAGTEITGQIPLTIALAERYFAGQLNSLQEEDVIKYLQVNLHWEAVSEEGQRLQNHRNLVEGLLVGVVSNEVTLPETRYEIPRYSPKITIYPEITTKEDGRSGRAEGTGITEENKYFN
jgi:tyrosinase